MLVSRAEVLIRLFYIYGSEAVRYKGSFNNYVDRILPFFDPPPTLQGQVLYPKREQKQTFFDPLPLHLVHVVIEWPLSPHI